MKKGTLTFNAVLDESTYTDAWGTVATFTRAGDQVVIEVNDPESEGLPAVSVPLRVFNVIALRMTDRQGGAR